MRRRTFFRLIRRFLACLIISAVFWSWIFNFLTDAGPEQKILLYADMREFRWKELAITLEEDLPEGIRWVQVHPFSVQLKARVLSCRLPFPHSGQTVPSSVTVRSPPPPLPVLFLSSCGKATGAVLFRA